MTEIDIIKVVQAYIPEIDKQLTDYIVAVLTSDSFSSLDDVKEAVGEVISSCFDDDKVSQEENLESICLDLFNILLENNNQNEDDNYEKQKLSAPIHLNSTNQENNTDDWKSIWSCDKEIESKVDAKKLRKAEVRLKQKAERREGVDEEIIDTTLHKLVQASASQSISKKTNKLELAGVNKTKDIKIENFDVSFGSNILLQGANLNLNYGERYGLCGRNGIGKSTLLHMIGSQQLIIPSHIRILHVEQEAESSDTLALDFVLESDLVRTNLLEEEKKFAQKTSMSDEESARLNQVYQELTAIEADKAPAKASIILSGLGFTSQMQQKPTKTFSGGWRMRLALARALFSKPDLLLLDEPTNMLDMKAIIWLTDYLVNNWKSTLLVVSHDRNFLTQVPTYVLHFHSKKIDVYHGNYEAFVTAMTEKLRNQEREYESQQMHIKHTQEFIDKFRYNNKRASLVQSRIKALDKIEKVAEVKKDPPVVFRFPQPEPLSPPILQLDEVTFWYGPEKVILSKVNLNANLQSRICIVGDNGSGKTTLLKLLTGELEPRSGIRHTHRNLAIGYFTQHHVDQIPMNISPLQFMELKQPGKPTEHYRKYLAGFGLSGDISLQRMSSLSGGQKSRVAFAAMTLTNPHVLILDEPTNHLDVETVDALAKSLNNYSGGVILVTHDQNMIQKVCTELWHCSKSYVTCLKNGFHEYESIIKKELAEISVV